jgi:hypothetical protein
MTDTAHFIKSYNERFAVVIMGTSGHLIYEPEAEQFYPEKTFKRKMSGDIYMPDQDRKSNRSPKSQQVADIWLDSGDKRLYHGLVFHPMRKLPDGSDYVGRGLNTWKGFAGKHLAITDRDKAVDDLTFILEHLLKVFHDGNQETYDWELDYWAHALQKPWEKPAANIVRFEPKGGSGKDLFAQRFLATNVFGLTHSAIVNGIDSLTGNFNSELARSVLVVGNEIAFGKDRRARDKLFAETGSPYRSVEYKGQDKQTFVNCSRFIIHSNSDNPVPASEGDRRFLLLATNQPLIVETPEYFEYFDRLAAACMSKDAAALFYEMMMARDIANFRKDQAPMTKAKSELIITNKPPREKVMLDWATEGYVENGAFKITLQAQKQWVTTAQLIEALPSPFYEYGTQIVSANSLAKFMKPYGLVPILRKGHGRGYWIPSIQDFQISVLGKTVATNLEGQVDSLLDEKNELENEQPDLMAVINAYRSELAKGVLKDMGRLSRLYSEYDAKSLRIIEIEEITDDLFAQINRAA